MGAPKGNQYALGNNGGHPLKYKSVEEMQELIDAYFDSCFEEAWKKNDDDSWEPILNKDGNIVKHQVRPFSVTGLACALGTTRDVLIDYQNRKEFANAIKMAKQRIEAYAEESLYMLKNPAGVIFSLKNNYGWKDKQEIDATVNINMSEAIQAARQRAKQTDG